MMKTIQAQNSTFHQSSAKMGIPNGRSYNFVPVPKILWKDSRSLASGVTNCQKRNVLVRSFSSLLLYYSTITLLTTCSRSTRRGLNVASAHNFYLRKKRQSINVEAVGGKMC